MSAPISFQGRPLEPTCTLVHGATITRPAIDPQTATYVGAVYDRAGTLVPQSLRPGRLGHFRPVDPLTVPRDGPVETEMGEAIYAGHLFPTWGHFLFETLSTAWAGPQLPPEAPVLFAPFVRDPAVGAVGERLKRWGGLLAAAGWGERKLLPVSAALRVRRLHVPERLSVFGAPRAHTAMHPAMRGIYTRIAAKIAGGTPAGRTRILACRPEGHDRAHPHEREVYAALETRGFVRVDGAELPPETQVRLFAGAGAVVGFSGSNLHNAAFAPPGTPVVEITDLRSHTRPQKRNRAQLAFADLMGQPYEIVNGFADEAAPVAAERLADAVTARLDAMGV